MFGLEWTTYCYSFALQNLPFQKVQHQVATFDAQPSSETGGILVLVTGALLVNHAYQLTDRQRVLVVLTGWHFLGRR